MNRASAFVALVLLGCSATLGLFAQDPTNTLDKARIDRLVQDLGSDSADIRETATRELRNLGSAVLPQLREAAKSPDAEVAYRAERLVEEIQRGGKPPAEQDATDSNRPTRPRRQTNMHFFFNGNGNFSVQRDMNGHIRVTVREEKDGADREETYEADSVEEFVQRYPEVAAKYGISAGEDDEEDESVVGPGFPGGNPFGGPNDPGLQKLQRDMMKQLGEILRDSRKSLDEMFKGLRPFRDRLGKDLDQDNPWMDFLGEEDEDMTGEDELNEDEVPAEDKPDSLIKRNTMRDLVRRQTGKLNDGLTVEFINPALRAQLGLEGEDGVQVADVAAGSAAEQAGIRMYDVILRVNGRPVRASLEFRRALLEAVDSGALTLDVIRKGKPDRIEVTGEALEAFRK